MTENYSLPDLNFNLEFVRWSPLGRAIAEAKPEPGIYLLRSRHLASQPGWPPSESPETPWRQAGVLYVGTSLRIQDRINQFKSSVDDEKSSSHSGSYRFRSLRSSPWYSDVGDAWPSDLEVAITYRRYVAPPHADEHVRRWASARLRSLEAIEALIVSDIQSHRIEHGCAWVLLNHCDWHTYGRN
jgi:hypothetical protein